MSDEGKGKSTITAWAGVRKRKKVGFLVFEDGRHDGTNGHAATVLGLRFVTIPGQRAKGIQ
jgi:hypothetical protein